MNSWFAWLKPAPHIPEIQDKEAVDRLYKYWRIRTLYSLMIGYALFYFTRGSFTYAVPGLIADLGFTKSELGFLATLFSISYGFSKFGSGILSDRSNPRYFMAFGLIMTGVITIFFGLSSSLVLFGIFWGLNGWFQGFGWPPCARFLTHWYSHSERGSWWSTWNVSHNIGAILIKWIVGFTLFYCGWRWSLWIPAVFAILGGLFLINRLRDTPQSIGLPPIEKYRNDYLEGKPADKDEQELTMHEILVDHVLKNRYIWCLAAAYFFVYFIRIGINDWTTLLLVEKKAYTSLAATGTLSIFDLGGLCGSLCAGWSSDFLFKAKRGPVNALFAVGIIAAVFLFWIIPPENPFLDCCALFMLGFTIFGPQMLIGVAAAELSHKKAAATSTGFVGWMAYIGAACAGFPLAKITEDFGWDGYFWFLTGCSVMAALLLLTLWNAVKPPSYEPVKPFQPKPDSLEAAVSEAS